MAPAHELRGAYEVHRSAVDYFIRNAWEPIGIPRWAVSLKYFLFAIVGAVSYFVGQPSLDLTTFSGYTPVWSAFVCAGGLIGFFGSLRPRWAALEAIGAVITVAFLSVLVLSFFIRGSLAVGILLTIVTVLPGTRAGFLVTRWVRKIPPGNHP
jgi:hypothetical protein